MIDQEISLTVGDKMYNLSDYICWSVSLSFGSSRSVLSMYEVDRSTMDCVSRILTRKVFFTLFGFDIGFGRSGTKSWGTKKWKIFLVTDPQNGNNMYKQP